MTFLRTDPRRTAAPLLFGLVAATGCGTVTGQRAQSSTVSQTASSTTTPGTQSTGPQSRSAAARRPSGITGQAVTVACGGANTGKQSCPRDRVIATIEHSGCPPKRIATVRTDHAGHFRLELAPAAYQPLARRSDYLLRARPLTARVLPLHFTPTTVRFILRHPLHVTAGSNSS
jgi:hypothetical protein